VRKRFRTIRLSTRICGELNTIIVDDEDLGMEANWRHKWQSLEASRVCSLRWMATIEERAACCCSFVTWSAARERSGEMHQVANAPMGNGKGIADKRPAAASQLT